MKSATTMARTTQASLHLMASSRGRRARQGWLDMAVMADQEPSARTDAGAVHNSSHNDRRLRSAHSVVDASRRLRTLSTGDDVVSFGGDGGPPRGTAAFAPPTWARRHRPLGTPTDGRRSVRA